MPSELALWHWLRYNPDGWGEAALKTTLYHPRLPSFSSLPPSIVSCLCRPWVTLSVVCWAEHSVFKLVKEVSAVFWVYQKSSNPLLSIELAKAFSLNVEFFLSPLVVTDGVKGGGDHGGKDRKDGENRGEKSTWKVSYLRLLVAWHMLRRLSILFLFLLFFFMIAFFSVSFLYHFKYKSLPDTNIKSPSLSTPFYFFPSPNVLVQMKSIPAPIACSTKVSHIRTCLKNPRNNPLI